MRGMGMGIVRGIVGGGGGYPGSVGGPGPGLYLFIVIILAPPFLGDFLMIFCFFGGGGREIGEGVVMGCK